MKNKPNYAYIDGQNLHLSAKELGWVLDLKKFRIYLQEKFEVDKAYYFIGYIEKYKDLYKRLRSYGYILVFKPTLTNNNREPKGNVDAELVLNSLVMIDEYMGMVLVTNDGDFGCLVKYLIQKEKFLTLISPNRQRCSILLRREAGKKIIFLNDHEQKLGLKRKGPHKDETS